MAAIMRDAVARPGEERQGLAAVLEEIALLTGLLYCPALPVIGSARRYRAPVAVVAGLFGARAVVFLVSQVAGVYRQFQAVDLVMHTGVKQRVAASFHGDDARGVQAKQGVAAGVRTFAGVARAKACAQAGQYTAGLGVVQPGTRRVTRYVLQTSVLLPGIDAFLDPRVGAAVVGSQVQAFGQAGQRFNLKPFAAHFADLTNVGRVVGVGADHVLLGDIEVRQGDKAAPTLWLVLDAGFVLLAGFRFERFVGHLVA